MKYIYRLYQLCVVLPLFLLASILTALVTVVGCLLGNGHFWGYYPGKCWSRFIVALLFLPVKVEGRENLRKGQSYVFVAWASSVVAHLCWPTSCNCLFAH